jgi:ADP-ribosylglycohydrolase
MSDPNFIYDRVAGCLLGMAAGEALGIPANGMTPWHVTKKFQSIDGFFSQRPGGAGCGQYGDGSRFVLNMAAPMRKSPKIEQGQVASAYVAMRGKVGGPWGDAADRMSNGTPFEQCGNSSLYPPEACFCGVPVGLWAAMAEAPSEVDILRACKLMAAPVYSIKACALAAFLVAYVIKDCIRNAKSLAGKEEMFERDLSLMSRAASWVRRAAASLEGEDKDIGVDAAERMDFARKSLQSGRGVAEFVGMHGNSHNAMECAVFSLFCFMRAPDDFRAACSAASMGGPAGVNAAMVGALCGAHSGLSFLPIDVQRGVSNAPRILALAEKLSKEAA